MIKEPKKTVSILMPQTLYEQIKLQADKTSRTISSYIRKVMKHYLWHVENSPETLVGKWDIK